VQSLARDGKGFHLDLLMGVPQSGGRGCCDRPFHPSIISLILLRICLELWCRIPSFIVNFSGYRGRNVVVVGLPKWPESAALLHKLGAQVEIIVRGPVRWISRRLYRYTGPARHLFYPPSDVGLLVSTG